MNMIKELLNRKNVSTGQPIDPNERINKQVESYNNLQGEPDLQTGYDCPLCKNKRLIAYNKDGYQCYYPCECEKTRTLIKNLKKSGLGAIDKHTFKNYISTEQWQQNILSTAKQFQSMPLGGWFFIGGQVGAGKTHIGKAISYEYHKQGIYVQYLEWNKDIPRLNALVNTPEYEKEFEKFITPPVLYIDDFLKSSNGNPQPGAINRATELIYARYNQPNTTVIISSEFVIDDIIRIDEGTGSRIVEMTKKYNSMINLNPDKAKNYRLK